MPAGRPSDYRPEYCDRVIACGKEGWSKSEMASALDVTRDTLDNWGAAHPEFFGALTCAMEHSFAWWEKAGREGLTAQVFQSALYAKAMAGRFPREAYRNQVALTGADGGAIQVEQREALDLTRLSPEERAALKQLLTLALARQVEQPLIEGEYEAKG